MNPDRSCPECGASSPAQSPDALCGACLLRLGLVSETGGDETAADHLAPLFQRRATPIGVQFLNLAHYELEGELARGGMGMVFRAWDPRLLRHVALKLLLPDQLQSEERVRRFRIEAEATARLEHPNIVPIHEIGQAEGQHFLCMKLIRGRTLADVLKQDRFAPERAGAFMAALADAIHYAHQRGVLHRDLKPGNILVDEHGQPQVTDFGLARLLEREEGPTLPNAVLGTPAYMSPEQAAGRSHDLTTASDTYSLGAIFYELLTGRPPFRAGSTLETLRQVRECVPAAPRLIDPSIPRDLETLCWKALAKNPNERYPSAGALADDLRRFLRGEPVLARPLPPAIRAVRWCRRHTGVTALLGGVLILLILFTGAALFERGRLLQDNRTFAALVAGGLGHELALFGGMVTNAAEQIQIQTQAAGRLDATHHIRLLDLLRQLTNRPPGAKGSAYVANWVLMDAKGGTLARSPEVVDPSRRLKNRSDRDYFDGALQKYRLTRQTDPFVSAAYDSREDGLRKLGISVVLPGATPDAEIAGVLTAMVRTTAKDLSTDFGIPNHDVVLVAPLDPADRARARTRPVAASDPKASWFIYLHPADPDTRTDPIRFPSASIGERTLTFYLDPMGHAYPTYAWTPWLVGLAPVPNTPFVVLVQSRDWILMALVPGLTLTAVLLGLGGWRAWRTPRANQTEPQPRPALQASPGQPR